MYKAALWAIALLFAFGATAESKGPFGGFKHDETQPIEIAADALEVRETDKIAVFSGAVDAQQGTLRLTADTVEVTYGGGDGGTGQIRAMKATGKVFIVNGAETASGDWAKYNVAGGVIEMGGSVTLTQGGNVVKGASLTIDLKSGQGKVKGGTGGRVKSTFTPAKVSE
ncbi:MAG: lipopolysaccharide transport periplasmic protein LptA [Pikeienuella sp.]